ncbi:hypothetical protein FRB99_004072, partial [Tulasnella sp. 403]
MSTLTLQVPQLRRMPSELSMSDSATVVDHEPSPPQSKLVKHPVHYYPDGNFIFVVENYIFRVYKGLLAQRSEVMHDLFNLPQDGKVGDGDQAFLDGVPAVTLEDSAEAFANVLDIILPGKIRPIESPSFDKLAGMYRISDKYLINDIRQWALSWLNEVLPSTLDDLWKVPKVYAEPATAARAIRFAQEVDLPQFLPLAFYALAYHRDLYDPENFDVVWRTLPRYDQLRLHRGRRRMQEEVLSRVCSLPDLGLQGRQACATPLVNGQTCGKTRQKGWTDPKDLIVRVCKLPLEELSRRVTHPTNKCCTKCTLEVIDHANLLREELFVNLVEFFWL